MDFDTIFTNYYTLYRAESQTPASTDDEYTIALRLVNDAVQRWANYDGTFWKELFTNLTDASDGDKTTVAAQKEYDCPTDFREAGGFVTITNSNNATTNIPIINVQDAQFKDAESSYAYFYGNPKDGYKVYINPAPTVTGQTINYVYYKKHSTYTTGTDTTEVPNAWFLVHHALANRFRASRNWSAYQTAKRDAEDILMTMKLDNDSGNWANPPQVRDTSGSVWGV